LGWFGYARPRPGEDHRGDRRPASIASRREAAALIREDAEQLRLRLKALGLSRSAIEAAWPRWWTRRAEASAAAKADLRFALARNLGLDPRSLLADNRQPAFVWQGQARFKNLSTDSSLERDAIASFGRAISNLLLAATPGETPLPSITAAGLRQFVLRQSPYVGLSDLLSIAWALGIPVVQLTVFPGPRKRMAAMSIRVGERYAILLAKEAVFPAPIAFYVAHELGHVALGHFEDSTVVVDFEEAKPTLASDDPEEIAADGFALELLTGHRDLKVVPAIAHSIAAELARVVLAAARDLQIEPGTLALCYGYSTKKWATTNAAMKLIYVAPRPVGAEVNGVARQQLHMAELPMDGADYIAAVMGA
jgi:hypothetical protein